MNKSDFKITEAPVIVVFGITGDLSKRKLLPALYHLLSKDVLPEDTKIIGVSRKNLTTQELLDTVELCVLEKDNVCDPVGLKKVQAAIQTFQLDPDVGEDFDKLKILLDQIDGSKKRSRLIYMSTPSDAYSKIVQQLGEHHFNDSRTKLLLEKPFGHNLESAKDLIKIIKGHYSEEQIYRIDHYLAKETAQNLLAFRMHNSIFQSIWDSEHIHKVTIRAYESIGIQGRADFYEKTGALRDLIQSHLLQLLCITLMDTPQSMNSKSIHESKQSFLKNVEVAEPSKAIRAQYDSYKKEVNNPTSHVETFASVKITHDSKRWKNTEILLETGKGLDKKITEIIIEFVTPHEEIRNKLTFQIQPDEGIHLDLAIKEPGFETLMKHAELYFQYKDSFGEKNNVDAYERVLMDALRNDQSLFASDQEVLETWQILDPVISAWSKNDKGLIIYKKGASDSEIIESDTIS